VGADGKARKDKLLPAIASMLDGAQFDLITKPGAGVVAIQGSAGSGKTTVGLHRIAYLHATDAARFRADRMLVIVPTEALIHYTARVLPDLGVADVPVMTFQRWAVRVLMDLYPKLPSRITDETPGVVVRMKTHSGMLRAIDQLVARTEREVDERLRAQMAKWEGGTNVIKAWEQTSGAVDLRVSALATWISGKRDIYGAPAPNTVPDVTKGALTQLGVELRKKSRGVLELWDELCTDLPLLERTFEGAKGFGPGQLRQANEWCTLQTRIRQEGERDGETPSLDAEDHALILRLFQALRGPLVDSDGGVMRCAHLFVDEVQDASPVELRVLMDLTGKDKSVTLSGDLAQRMLEDDDDRGEFQWSDLLGALDLPHTGEGVMEPLKVSYRSTAQITKFAREVLGPHAHEAEPIADRHGPPVEMFPFSSAGEAVAFLADALRDLHQSAPHANVAVLARFGPQADVYFEGLERAEVPNVRRVRRQDFSWEPGVDVTDVRQTKGLEWDEVVLVDVNKTSYPDSSQARHAMYVGATRAAHQLWCVASEEPSPIASSALQVVPEPPAPGAEPKSVSSTEGEAS
jgi:DNA helicase-2/ATP-dependent DNA helicase PcrA